MPALFTRPCSPPNFSAAFTAVSQSLSCVTSCGTNASAGPSSDASWRPSDSSTSPMTTRAPSAANKRASAAPCPRAPPLMSMTFPLRRSILSSICLKNVGTFTDAYHAMLTAARRASSSSASWHLGGRSLRRSVSDHEFVGDAAYIHLEIKALHRRAREMPGQTARGGSAADDLVGEERMNIED